jgi:ATP-dependent RNA helicase RhlE
VKQLEANGFLAAAIHGNKSQGARTKALDDFKQGRVQVLVATDIAARGIDIDLLPLVVNYDLPNVSEDYVHRIGRTARAGASGQAISLVSPEEVRDLRGIEKLIGQRIEQCRVEGFDEVDLVKGRPAPKREQRQPRGRAPQGGRGNNSGNSSGNNGGNNSGNNSGNRSGGNRGNGGKPPRR